MSVLPAWRPSDRHEIVAWVSNVATGITCAALRHPLSREARQGFMGDAAYCPCGGRRYDGLPGRRRE